MAVITMNLFSVYVKQNMDVTVVLPDDVVEAAGKGALSQEDKLPCVWLYHGGSGDHTEWLYHTNLVDYVNERRFAAVLPNVHESCFVDMNIGSKYGTYVGRELPNFIHNSFSCISDKREDNYVSGLSNGGYGCLHVGLRNPDRFGWIGAFSAGDKADSEFLNDGSPKSLHRIRLFGDGDLHNNKYGLTYQANRLLEQGYGLTGEKLTPKIYHACGGKDPWLAMNHIVRYYFLEHNEDFVYTYDEIEELGHEWRFWEEELIRFLDHVGLVAVD